MKRWSPKHLVSSRRGRWATGGGAVVIAIVVFVGAAVITHLLMTKPKPGHLDHSLKGVQQPITPTQPANPAPVVAAPTAEGPCWSNYGRNAGRLSDGADLGHGVPVTKLWAMHLGLMEFPPAFCDGVLYVNTQHGFTWAVTAINKHVVWKAKTATQFDSTPAVTATRVIIGTYDPGGVSALDRRTGKLLWRLKTGGSVESSPVVVNGIVYATSKDHRIYAISEATGHVLWAFETADEVKDSPSVANGLVYVANYAAEVYALNARTGKVRWRKTFRGLLGDRIYSSVPVRGSTAWFATVRGDVYAVNALTGATRWHSSIPGYVYSTPAVSGNRVYIGNYPGTLYAFDARSGRQVWSHSVGGSISGSPTVIGSLVYVSSLSATRTVAYSTATGKQMWTNTDGRYVTGIATDRALYLSLGSELSRWSTAHTRDVVSSPAPATTPATSAAVPAAHG